MSPRSKEQNEEIRKQKRDLIMNVALELFATKGYYATSISQIAKKAEISKGLLYNYFDSKETLLIDIAYEGMEDILASFDPNHDGVLTKEEFHFFIRENFRIYREKKAYWKFYFSLFLQPGAIELVQDEFKGTNTYFVEKLLGFFQSQGFEDPMGELAFFSSVLKGACLQYVFTAEGFPLEAIENRILNLYK